MTDGKPSLEQLEGYREYLRMLARIHLVPALRSRVDASDVVQEVLVRACQALRGFTFQGQAELLAWLRAILVNYLRDLVRRNLAEARDVQREQSLEASLQESSARLEAFLAASGSSPGEQVVRQERLIALANALALLPDEQREAIELKHLQGQSVAEIGARLGKTHAAVAGLLRRGLERLRAILDEPDKLEGLP